ncbi:unnamed protein product [Ilex paraguariensis]|uniref:Uncharacterized protein n=1 Tax=Ilex paraguariensis TaxID=185542 RepID=A0ABC8UEA8_9AQUA
MIIVRDELNCMPDTSTEMAYCERRSIYRVASCVTDLNKKAYKPQAVSFGPYHHGEEYLKAMEDHRQRAFLHFLKRSNKSLEYVVD